MNPKGLTDLIGLAKLADTIGKGIGWYLEPQQVRRLAAANADAEVTRELGHQAALTIAERAAQLRQLESLTEQRNLEAIIREAAALLSDTEQISGDPVESDWTAEFFNQARLIGDPEVQSLWARLLAGEVASPRSYSRRTLAVLKQLSKAEAELFATFASVVWEIEDDAVFAEVAFRSPTDEDGELSGSWRPGDEPIIREWMALIKKGDDVPFELVVTMSDKSKVIKGIVSKE